MFTEPPLVDLGLTALTTLATVPVRVVSLDRVAFAVTKITPTAIAGLMPPGPFTPRPP